MIKLLVICGPTATGKTELAYKLSKKFQGELISADSRMVYKYMDIGTGKDKEKYGEILGYDLVNPNEEFSISQYAKFANDEIKRIFEEKKLPILVGGTGLYIKSVIENIATVDIAVNKTLRENLKDKTVEELVKILRTADAKKLSLMNNSDRNNPRRLIRAIEVASDKSQANKMQAKNYDVLVVGLSAPLDEIKRRINERVDKRIRQGFEEEIKFLKEKNFWDGAPSKTIGYKHFPNIEKWKLEEFKYAKRQITWFKKQKNINWFDVTGKSFEKEVENLVQKWYSDSNNAAQN